VTYICSTFPLEYHKAEWNIAVQPTLLQSVVKCIIWLSSYKNIFVKNDNTYFQDENIQVITYVFMSSSHKYKCFAKLFSLHKMEVNHIHTDTRVILKPDVSKVGLRKSSTKRLHFISQYLFRYCLTIHT